MKYFLLIGGFSGFTAAFLGGLAVGNDFAAVVFNACIGCMIGALLFRGFRALLTQQLRSLVEEQSRTKTDSGVQPTA